MALGDITILEQASMTGRGGRLYNVLASTNLINAGEPVVMFVGNSNVTQAGNNIVLAPSPYTQTIVSFVGVAATTSTNTSSAAGKVTVWPANSGTTYLINANSAASVDTQAEYDAVVGRRVLMDLTAGSYTLLTTDSSINGFVIQAMDVTKYPGKIAFTVRTNATNLS